MLKTGLGDKPLWSQVYDIISERIDTGEYSVGEVLPAEIQLMDEFKVSRITIRQAMDKLIRESRIIRKRGKGTIVLERKDAISTIFQSSFDKVREMQGDISKKVVSVKMISPSKEIKYYLEIKDNKKVLELIRFNEDSHGNILAVHISYINSIVGLTDKDDHQGSLYDHMARKGYIIESVIEEISASISDEEEKNIFKLTHDTAIISRRRRGFSKGRLVEYSISKYNAEGYRLIINNK